MGDKMVSVKRLQYSNFIIPLIFIDLLLLPNFPLFVMPMSLPIVMIMVVLKKIKIEKDKYYVVYIIMVFFVLASVVMSFLQRDNYLVGINIPVENIKRAFQLLTSFFYFFTIKSCASDFKMNIKKILMIFVTLYISLGLVSYYNTALYFKILELLSINNPFVSDWFLRQRIELFRYSYIWIDPNNATYALQMVIFYMLVNEKLNLFETLYLYFSLILSLLFGMSTGGLISATSFFVLYILNMVLRFSDVKTSYKKILFGIISFILGVIISGTIFIFLKDKFASIIEYSFNRMSNNTSGGRIDKYSFMFGNKIPNIIGEGYVLIREGLFFRPHSDHLRFIYSYGLIAYISSIWFFFRKVLYSSKYLFIIPGFMAYSINSLIDEQKILLVLLCLLAYLEGNKNSESNSNIHNTNKNQFITVDR